jgi:hypothetical protein
MAETREVVKAETNEIMLSVTPLVRARTRSVGIRKRRVSASITVLNQFRPQAYRTTT